MAVASGTLVGSYEVDCLLGHGGMGAVYKAHHKQSGETVALKFLLTKQVTDTEALEASRRFRDEAAAALKLSSPYLVHMLDSGESAEHGPYLVLEYLPGQTLRAYLEERGPMELREAYEKVALPLLSALKVIHEAGVIHRDVKPENLFAGVDGKFKLGDLGLATFEGREAATRTGLIVGSPGYIAPERLMEANVAAKPAADVFSAGIVLCEALVGHHPFPNLSAMDRLVKPIEKRHLRRMGLPASLVEVLGRAVHKKVGERTQQAQELLSQLKPLLCDESLKMKPAATALVPSAVAIDAKALLAKKAQPNKRYGLWVFTALLLCAIGLALVYPSLQKPTKQVGGRKFPSLPSSLEKPISELHLAGKSLDFDGDGNPSFGGVVGYLAKLDNLVGEMKKRRIEAIRVEKPWEHALAGVPEDSPLRVLADGYSAALSGDSVAKGKMEQAALSIQREKVKEKVSAEALFLEQLLFERSLLALDFSDGKDKRVEDKLFDELMFLGELPGEFDEHPAVAAAQFNLHTLKLQRVLAVGKTFQVAAAVPLLSLLRANPRLNETIARGAHNRLQKLRTAVFLKIKEFKHSTDDDFVALLQGWSHVKPTISSAEYVKRWNELLIQSDVYLNDMRGAGNTLRMNGRQALRFYKNFKIYKNFEELPPRYRRLIWGAHGVYWPSYTPIVPYESRKGRFDTCFSRVAYTYCHYLYGSEMYQRQLDDKLFWPTFEKRDYYERSFQGLLRLATKIKAHIGKKDRTPWFAAERLLMANALPWFRGASQDYPKALLRNKLLLKNLPEDSISFRMVSAIDLFSNKKMVEAVAESKKALDYALTFEPPDGPGEGKAESQQFWHCIVEICRERWAYLRFGEKTDELLAEAKKLSERCQKGLKEPRHPSLERLWSLSILLRTIVASEKLDGVAKAQLKPYVELIADQEKQFSYGSKARFILRGEIIGPREF